MSQRNSIVEVPADDRRPGLKPPQFRLSTLMLLVALLCAIFAVLGTVGPYAAFALVLLVLAVFAHVAGNSIGTRLRENGSRPLPVDGKPAQSFFRRRKLTKDDYAPTTRLGHRHSLGMTVVVMTLIGVALGAAGGGTLLALANWQRITWPSLVFAVLFAGILGGFVGFLTSSLVKVLIGVHLEATREMNRQ